MYVIDLIIMKENFKRRSALIFDTLTGSHIIKGLFYELFDVKATVKYLMIFGKRKQLFTNKNLLL